MYVRACMFVQCARVCASFTFGIESRVIFTQFIFSKEVTYQLSCERIFLRATGRSGWLHIATLIFYQKLEKSAIYEIVNKLNFRVRALRLLKFERFFFLQSRSMSQIIT